MGYLEIIIGPMFSGKTSELIKNYNEKISENKKVLAINYDKDTRYGNNKIISHDKKFIKSFNFNSLCEIDNNLFQDVEWIYINEAQFFKDLKPWILHQINTTNKNYVICGLDSDFKREKFGDMLDLIPHSDKITKLYGECHNCKEQSLYTHRVSHEEEQEVIGTNNYIPVCRNCYNIMNYNFEHFPQNHGINDFIEFYIETTFQKMQGYISDIDTNGTYYIRYNKDNNLSFNKCHNGWDQALVKDNITNIKKFQKIGIIDNRKYSGNSDITENVRI